MPRRKLPRFSPTLLSVLVSGALLSGCDLWGTSGMPASTQAAPASTDPAVAAQPESTAVAGYLFGKTNVTGVVQDVDENGAPMERVTLIGQQLHIIDPSTGQEVGSGPIWVDADSTQVVAASFAMLPGGLSQQADNVNNTLFFTNAHQLYKVSLANGKTAFQQQVSSEGHVCELVQAIPKDATAASSWVVLTATRTSDGDCTQADQVVTKVVDSDADADTPASNSDQIAQVLTVRRDATGKLMGVLGSPPWQPGQANRPLVVMQADGTVGTLPLNLSGALSTTYFDRVAGSQTQAYLRVTTQAGVQLYVLDWSSTTPSLARSPLTTLNNADSVFVHADTGANYFVDGLSLQALPSGGSVPTTLATLSKGAPQAGGVMTSSYLVVPQQADDGTVSLQAFSKTLPGDVHDIALPQAGGAVSIVAHNADVLIVSQALDPNSTRVTLWRVDLNQRPVILPTPLTPDTNPNTALPVTVISTIQAASETLTGEQQQAYVLWSNALSDGTLRVSSHQLAGAQTYTLASGIPSWDLAQTTFTSVSQGLLASTANSTDTLWLFDAGKAASLTKVQPAAAQ